MDWPLILEYFKVILSVQMVTAIIIIVFLSIYHLEVKGILNRIIKLPGGVELSTPQLEKVKTEKPMTDQVSSIPQSTAPPVPTKDETFKNLYDSERTRSYFWEYSYLNYFLVEDTQRVLDWIAGLTSPLSTDLFNTYWMALIPNIKERGAILDALETHSLIEVKDNLISITPKGNEYQTWIRRKKPLSTS